jgi:type VI secretion system protein ImpE
VQAEQTLRDGKADQALTELQQEIRRNPADPKLRVFLFQLLAIQGQWERALVQLNTAAELDPGALAMAQMYREALRCEALRTEVFAGKRSPLIFGEPPAWIGLLVEALRLAAQGQHAAAEQLREQALEAAEAISGRIDGQPFEWLADADPRLGPTIECIVAGRYLWAPIQNIRQIVIEKPEDLRDLVWMPVHFTWSNGGDTVGLIPTRYPGSEHSQDEAIRMARKTLWVEASPGTSWGLGQRLFATDAGDYALMDTRKIELDLANEATAMPPTSDV